MVTADRSPMRRSLIPEFEDDVDDAVRTVAIPFSYHIEGGFAAMGVSLLGGYVCGGELGL